MYLFARTCMLFGTCFTHIKITTVQFGFIHFRPNLRIHSYRGYYEDLALGYTDEYQKEDTTVEALLKILEEAVGKTYTGYKGGDFYMDENTALWVANHSESGGTAIVDVIDCSYYIILKVEIIDT